MKKGVALIDEFKALEVNQAGQAQENYYIRVELNFNIGKNKNASFQVHIK